jgi:hypothetical protein
LSPGILACAAALLAVAFGQPCAAQIVTDSDPNSGDASEVGEPVESARPAADAAAPTGFIPPEDRAIAEQAARIKRYVLERSLPEEAPPSLARNEKPEFDHATKLEGYPTEHVGKRKPESTWYGWQILISDGASAGMFLAGMAAKEGALMGTAAVSFFVVPPIIHSTHGRGGVGWGSFGIRAGVALLALSAPSTVKASGDTAAGTALLFGLGATAIDAGALAWERPSKNSGEARAHHSPGVALAPRIGLHGRPSGLQFSGVW